MCQSILSRITKRRCRQVSSSSSDGSSIPLATNPTGFVFTAIGDILFAYFSTLGLTSIDPAVHAMYLVAYGALAAGAMVQRRLLAA